MEQENNTQEPVVAEGEMKMPEERFGSTAHTPERTTHLGIILGILIVILVLILGGLYLFGTTLQNSNMDTMNDAATRPTADQNNEPESTTADAQVQALETVSTSNEISAIEADISSTNLDAIDAELNAIDAELNASLQSI